MLDQLSADLTDIVVTGKTQLGNAARILEDANNKPSGSGDLRRGEVAQIQRVVDVGDGLAVVGSAAKGTRINIDSDLPFKSAQTAKTGNYRSDIDYSVRSSVVEDKFYSANSQLPDIDPRQGILYGADNAFPYADRGAIVFRPNQRPAHIDGEFTPIGNFSKADITNTGIPYSASRLTTTQRISGLQGRAPVANRATLAADEIRVSQKSVSYLKQRPGEASYTYDDIVTTMRQDG